MPWKKAHSLFIIPLAKNYANDGNRTKTTEAFFADLLKLSSLANSA